MMATTTQPLRKPHIQLTTRAYLPIYLTRVYPFLELHRTKPLSGCGGDLAVARLCYMADCQVTTQSLQM
jgi:hypothetical protein